MQSTSAQFILVLCEEGQESLVHGLVLLTPSDPEREKASVIIKNTWVPFTNRIIVIACLPLIGVSDIVFAPPRKLRSLVATYLPIRACDMATMNSILCFIKAYHHSFCHYKCNDANRKRQ